jgi:allophanate hydrolase
MQSGLSMTPGPHDSLDLATLAERYGQRRWTIVGVMREVLRRIAAYPDKAVWIDRAHKKQIDAQMARVQTARAAGKDLPLYGVPFAVKDNIDVADEPTTAACPAFRYMPEKSATVVQKLCDAGAILVGKTNMDQFAVGLAGVRSPYGACDNPFDARYISGGSSSGSAVAVSAGLCSFALGTDTAGSGRVPAAFNNIVGLKPTRGLISCAGVVPACRSLDCVSIFALTCDDAAWVASIAAGHDPHDPYSRKPREMPHANLPWRDFRYGVPQKRQMKFFGNSGYEKLFDAAEDRLSACGGKRCIIDFEPFAEAAKLLYQGPWIAERAAAMRGFLETNPDALLPVLRTILAEATKYTAADAFSGEHRLAELRQAAAAEWEKMDLLLLPTTPTIYTQKQVAADPIQLNTNLGYYTNFVNLMDLCAVAVPAGFTSSHLPMGVTLIAPAGQEKPLLRVADALHRSANSGTGAARAALPPAKEYDPEAENVLLAVVGAHLSGQPLNVQLTSRNARLVRACRTSPEYRLFTLANTAPPKPGLVRVPSGKGSPIAVEVWELSDEAFGSFVTDVPPPMAIGTVNLEDGRTVKGFLCEPIALEGATDITQHGGWIAYLKSRG